jgi:hypothetical protein
VFGGFVFLLLFFAMPLHFPVCGVWLLFCLSGFSDLNSARLFCGGGFCLESLILAQDERWRRA